MNENINNYIFEFIKEKNIDKYIGVIAYGSIINGTSNELSDLDIMVIKKNHDSMDCGSAMINGIRVEYFIHGITNLYHALKREIENNDPSHLTKFATCKIIIDETGEIHDLVSFAKELYLTNIIPHFTDKERFEMFSIKNRLDDLEELKYRQEFYSIYYVVLEKIRNLYTTTEGLISLPLTKYYKLINNYELYSKYVSCSNHDMPCSEFVKKYNDCLMIDDSSKMLNSLIELYHYCFDKYKFNSENFQLCYKNNPPWKV